MENDSINYENLKNEAGNHGSEDLSARPPETSGLKDLTSQKTETNRKLFLLLRTFLFAFITIILFFSAIVFVVYGVPVVTELASGHRTAITNDSELTQTTLYKKQINQIDKDIQRLSRKYNAYTSGQSYIVINTTDNRFFLYRNKKLLREGFCSSGSYTMLQTAGNKKWIFKTPKGKYQILGKTTNPVWKKPDWAFVEEGLPIPSANDFSRYEYGVLGDYALAIGDGYMIHGTIYKRFLGMPVTHGCVRLNDEDLEVIYNTLNIGSKVYIF
jgi:hypothetical protein